MSILDHPIVPVVVIDDPAHAIPLANALSRGGIRCAEITLRTPAGLDAIRAIAADGPDGFVVGAGTVLTTDDADRAVAAGATFVVSPGLDQRVVERAGELGVEPVPGVASATEVQTAHRLGLRHVKLFPAHLVGGLQLIDALRGPFPEMSFLPSGGVGPHNAAEYIRHDGVFAISGSWVAPRGLIADRSFDEIELLCREAAELVAG